MRVDDLRIGSGILLNFYPTPFYLKHPFKDILFKYKGVEWRFQAMKYLALDLTEAARTRHGIRYHQKVTGHSTAKGAKSAGRSLSPFDSEVWDKIAYGMMLEATLAKFTQHKESRRALLETESRNLIEHRPDPIWGDNLDGSGENLMGEILMLVRAALR